MVSACTVRLGIILLLHLAYFTPLVWQAFQQLNIYGDKHKLGLEQEDIVRIDYRISIAWTCLGGIFILASPFVSKKSIKHYDDTHINFSNLAFIFATFYPYGITLHYAHLNAARSTASSSNNQLDNQLRTECVTLERYSMETYYILLSIFFVILFTNIIYPYPGKKYSFLKSLISTFALLDVIDMAELIFGDVGCFQSYGGHWLNFFYTTLVISAILTTASYGLEQQKDDYCALDYICTILNMGLNDLAFFILRVATMSKQGHGYFGFIFVMKEFGSFFLRATMLCMKGREN